MGMRMALEPAPAPGCVFQEYWSTSPRPSGWSEGTSHLDTCGDPAGAQSCVLSSPETGSGPHWVRGAARSAQPRRPGREGQTGREGVARAPDPAGLLRPLEWDPADCP